MAEQDSQRREPLRSEGATGGFGVAHQLLGHAGALLGRQRAGQQAEDVLFTGHRRKGSYFASSRKAVLSTLPVALRGSAGSTRKWRGTL